MDGRLHVMVESQPKLPKTLVRFDPSWSGKIPCFFKLGVEVALSTLILATCLPTVAMLISSSIASKLLLFFLASLLRHPAAPAHIQAVGLAKDVDLGVPSASFLGSDCHLDGGLLLSSRCESNRAPRDDS